MFYLFFENEHVYLANLKIDHLAIVRPIKPKLDQMVTINVS